MDYGRLLATSWAITRRHKILWFWGLLAVLGSGGGGLVRILLNLFLNPDVSNLELRLQQFEETRAGPELFLSRLGTTLVLGLLVLLFLLLVGWLLFAWAEGAIITGTVAATKSAPVTTATTSEGGGRLLGRFIAIDAAVFFPLFLLLLLMLLLGGGSLIGGLLSVMRSDEPTALLPPLALGGLCLLPLVCLLWPISVGTVVFRGLAFRDTALFQNGVRAAIRHTWQVVKANWGPLLIVTGLLWGGRTLLGLLVGLLNFPLLLLAFPLLSSVPWLLYLLTGGLALIVLFLEAGLHTFTAVAWTVAYLRLGDHSQII